MSYKEKHSFADRAEESRRVLTKHRDRIPIIVEVAKSALREFPSLAKHKYLVPTGMTVGQFLYTLRKQIVIPATTAVFLFVNGGQLPPTSLLIGQLYQKYKDDDGFLYTTLHNESVFG